MQKFSKKLVSKVIYMKILLASSPDLLELFLREKGWELLNIWFNDAIKSLNWPLCAEMTRLFTLCPMTAKRLKENVSTNLAPKLIRQLSCDPRVEAPVRETAGRVLVQWMAVVGSEVTASPPSPAVTRKTRGSRSVGMPQAMTDSGPRVPVIAFTDVEDIVNLATLVTSQPAMAMTSVTDSGDAQVWLGKCASARAARMAGRGAGRKKVPLAPGRSKELVGNNKDSEEENTPSKDDPFEKLLSNSIDIEQIKVNNTMKLIGVIRNETLVGPERMRVKSSAVREEEDAEPVKILQGLAMEVTETLKKENKEKESVKEKENRDSKKEKERAKEREARRERERKERRIEGNRREEKKDRDKDKEKHRSSSDRESDKLREEKRRKERERERQKEKERRELKEKKRESKPYRETEMRDGLDLAEKLKIRELAQKLRDESKSNMDFKSVSLTAGLAKIPKLPKAEVVKREDPKLPKKSGPSFEDLMFQMDSSSAQPPIKQPPIKNKSRDLMASLCEDSPVIKPNTLLKTERTEKKLPSDLITTEEKSNGPLSPVPKSNDKTIKPLKLADIIMLETRKPEIKAGKKEEKVKTEVEKKPLKREHSDGEPKLRIKSAAQLKESPLFGDYLSTILPDQPKKKKIKVEDLKAKKEVNGAEGKNENLEKSLADAASSFSFYRDTVSENKAGKESPEERGGSSSPPRSPNYPRSDCEVVPEEPRSPPAREVRGILVLAKGPKRIRRIQWRPQDSLVQVEYFELDETERVNVNKLKFEEARKHDSEVEKSWKNRKPEVEDLRPWRGLLVLDCELPEIEFGGNSNEKKEQEQRENKVLQILFFNSKLASDPSEPDAAKGDRILTKVIPLEDMSGEEAYTDYSCEPWPQALQEVEASTRMDSAIQPNLLQTVMGGLPLPETSNTGSLAMDAALYAAQKAAEAELRRHGALPPLEDEDAAMEELAMDPTVPPPFKQPEYTPGGPTNMDLYNYGPPAPWHHMNHSHKNHRGGPFYDGVPPNHVHDFRARGGFMHGGGPMRGLQHHKGHSNGYSEEQGGWDRRGEGGGKEYSRPCKFWMEKGFCREDNRCKFPHSQGRCQEQEDRSSRSGEERNRSSRSGQERSRSRRGDSPSP